MFHLTPMFMPHFLCMCCFLHPDLLHINLMFTYNKMKGSWTSAINLMISIYSRRGQLSSDYGTIVSEPLHFTYFGGYSYIQLYHCSRLLIYTFMACLALRICSRYLCKVIPIRTIITCTYASNIQK